MNESQQKQNKQTSVSAIGLIVILNIGIGIGQEFPYRCTPRKNTSCDLLSTECLHGTWDLNPGWREI